jgi:hypothetical protein
MLKINNYYIITIFAYVLHQIQISLSDCGWREEEQMFLQQVIDRLLHIDFLQRSRIVASIQPAPPRAVALPPRILASSATCIHSRMAY